MADFLSATDADGVTVITWDMPGRSMNVLTMAGMAELEAAIDAALADPAVRAVVLTSGKADFAGGMDLAVLAGMKTANGATPAAGIFAGVMGLHRILRKIERAGGDPKTLTGGKPIVAALPGTALGIGLELPLCCHRIIAADNPKARIGLPEIRIGLFPGAGGTTRLSRKLGLLAAAPFLLEGRLETPARMLAAGIIDEVVPPADLVSRAKHWALSAGEADLVKPWDRKGFRFPGGGPYHPEGALTFAGASAMVMGRTQGVYPAARAMLSAIYEGALLPFDAALTVEARWFTSVMLDPSSEAMIRTLFLDKEALDKGARRPPLPDAPVSRLGIVGAGMMGAGIAQVAASAGLPVVLVDSTEAAATAGLSRIAAALDKAVQRRKFTPERRAEVLARITAGSDTAGLAGCDLVIEAVFEDPAVKAEVIARIAAAAPEAIIATNTSTLPVSGLAAGALRPEAFLGVHFFSPVERMALVEVIRGAQTGDAAVARALDLVRQLRKTPIVVNDARFFYANRCIIPYINEGLRMVGEGVGPALIEHAARGLGMPVGPLQLVDETSLDLGVRIARATRAAMGTAYPDGDVDRVLFAMVAAGRTGRKAGAGFYEYDAKGQRLGLWPGLAGILAPGEANAPTRGDRPSADPGAGVDPVKAADPAGSVPAPGAANAPEATPRADGAFGSAAGARPPVADLRERLLMIQALEAVRAFEEEVLTDPREGDVGAILGWGFAPWSGGPFAWLDRIGASQAVERAGILATRHGPRFAPPRLLRAMAREGRRFHDRRGMVS